MATRPGVLCKLKKGKIIDTQKGFVDTFNWMVDFCDKLKGDKGLKVDRTKSDAPVIKIDKLYYA